MGYDISKRTHAIDHKLSLYQSEVVLMRNRKMLVNNQLFDRSGQRDGKDLDQQKSMGQPWVGIPSFVKLKNCHLKRGLIGVRSALLIKG